VTRAPKPSIRDATTAAADDASAGEARKAGLRFECTQCGQCCTNRGDYQHLYVSDPEVVRLARFLGLLPAEFRRRFTWVDEYGWTQVFLDERCVFLDPQTMRCKVYPVRPTQCRTFPFWRDLVREGGWTDTAQRLCEGVGRGPAHPADAIERQMQDMERSSDE
jgi:Fe-S-cluster containining protein